MSNCNLTTHAQQRRKEMRVTEDDIDRVLADPLMSYPGRDGATCHVRNGLVVVVDASGYVITILWHGKEHR